MTKIIRTICFFSKNPNKEVENKLIDIEESLKEKGYIIQTEREPKSSHPRLVVKKTIVGCQKRVMVIAADTINPPMDEK